MSDNIVALLGDQSLAAFLQSRGFEGVFVDGNVPLPELDKAIIKSSLQGKPFPLIMKCEGRNNQFQPVLMGKYAGVRIFLKDAYIEKGKMVLSVYWISGDVDRPSFKEEEKWMVREMEDYELVMFQ